MLNYAVCEISGKQYKILPNKVLEIDYQGEGGKVIGVNVLLVGEDGKIRLGTPYLKEKLNLKVLDNIKGKKIRVSKYHAKANFRKVLGFRPKFTRVVLEKT